MTLEHLLEGIELIVTTCYNRFLCNKLLLWIGLLHEMKNRFASRLVLQSCSGIEFHSLPHGPECLFTGNLPALHHGEGLDDLLGVQAADAVMQGFEKDQSSEDLHLQWRSSLGMLPDEAHSLVEQLLQLCIGLEGIYLLSDPGVS